MSDILSSVQTVSIKITTKTGKDIDVSQFFTVINIYQSLINRKFINGRIVLIDTVDFLSNFPIIGNENVLISIQNSHDSSVINYNFKIYKVDRDVNTFTTQQKVKMLNIYLYTEEEFNNYTKISKKFSGTGSSILTTLLQENIATLKDFDSEVTTNEFDFISNYWTFEKCVDLICDHSFSSFFDYVFYENNNGFNFKPLSYLFSQTPINTLKIDMEQQQFTNIDNILRYQNNSYFDDLIWRKKGMFGSTGFQLDSDSYSYEYNSESISDIDVNITHSGINKMYNNQIDNFNNVYTTYENYKINLTKTTHLNFLSRYNFVVNLNGDLDRNVGQLFTINFPSLDNESPSGSDSFSGDWLALEINTSIFQNNDVKQVIQFGKNALFNNYRLDKY